MTDWCDFGDLPADQCACPKCKPDTKDNAGYEISYHFPAHFASTIDCGHRVELGDTIAKTVDGEHICSRCAK